MVTIRTNKGDLMSNNGTSKLKLLYLRQILEDETDADHGLTMPQLIARLEDYGVEAERKSIYRDLDTLREFGLDIRTLPRRPVQYAMVRQGFTLPELKLLADCVESSKFLTKHQTNMLITNLKLLASDHEREQLDRRIHVTGRIRSKNKSAFLSIDTIHEAKRLRRKVSFRYFRLGADGQRHLTHGGRPHVVTPVAVAYDEGFYYLTAWNDQHDSMTEFRIDRMDNVCVTDQRATANDAISGFAFDKSAPAYFGRFGGEVAHVALEMPADRAEIVLDRFGEDVPFDLRDDGTAQAHVSVHVSPQFFGWVAGLNSVVTLVGPARIVEEYRAYLAHLLEG